MSCVLTSGFSLDCRDSVGGIKTLYVTELANKATLTAASGVVTAFTLSTGKQFFTYSLEKETASITENVPDGIANGTLHYEQQVTFTLNKLSASSRNELRLLAQNQLMVIALDRNGKYWLLGQNNGLELQTLAAASGTAMGDRNGYTITLVGKEETPMQEVSSGLISTLTSPAV